MTRRPIVSIAILTVSMALAACGGGGSSGSAPPPVTPTPSPSPGQTSCTSVARENGIRRAARAGAVDLVPNRLFVTYRPGVRDTSSVERSVSAVDSADLHARSGLLRSVTLPAGADADTAAATLRRSASVASVDRMHYRYLAADGVSNDPDLNDDDQWYLYKTNVDSAAWSHTHGSAAVSVAVIDTGVDETNQDFIFDIKESVLSGQVTTGAGSVQDTDGHGTNTSGLATAQTNNGYGYAGVGYSTHLQAYKIFPNATSSTDCPTAATGDEVTAINDAVSNGASVISLSIGSPQTGNFDTQEQKAVEDAIAAGVVVVAAAGNEYPGTGGDAPDYPAGYANVIAVGASAVGTHTAKVYSSIANEVVASYSNSGPTLVAPGGDAGSSSNNNDPLLWIEGYGSRTTPFQTVQCKDQTPTGVCALLFNGTSQATPQVAAAVALMEAYHGGKRSLTPAQATSILTSTADKLDTTQYPASRQGAGRLDTGAAVAAAHP